jgi:hypothetical protein
MEPVNIRLAPSDAPKIPVSLSLILIRQARAVGEAHGIPGVIAPLVSNRIFEF